MPETLKTKVRSLKLNKKSLLKLAGLFEDGSAKIRAVNSSAYVFISLSIILSDDLSIEAKTGPELVNLLEDRNPHPIKALDFVLNTQSLRMELNSYDALRPSVFRVTSDGREHLNHYHTEFKSIAQDSDWNWMINSFAGIIIFLLTLNVLFQFGTRLLLGFFFETGSTVSNWVIATSPISGASLSLLLFLFMSRYYPLTTIELDSKNFGRSFKKDLLKISLILLGMFVSAFIGHLFFRS